MIPIHCQRSPINTITIGHCLYISGKPVNRMEIDEECLSLSLEEVEGIKKVLAVTCLSIVDTFVI
jgi:hypothetical protein